MITGLYAAILAIFFCRLALNVVKLRRSHQVSLGDGGVDELQQAISAHNNAAQYSPIFLILLFLLESSSAFGWLVHIVGIAFVVGRYFHWQAITQSDLKKRVLSMQITLFSIIGLSAVNIIYYLLSLFTTGVA